MDDSKSLIESGDEEAVSIYEDYNEILCPPTYNQTKVKIDDILNYLDSFCN